MGQGSAKCWWGIVYIYKKIQYNLNVKLQNQWICYEGNETYMRRELMTWR